MKLTNALPMATGPENVAVRNGYLLFREDHPRAGELHALARMLALGQAPTYQEGRSPFVHRTAFYTLDGHDPVDIINFIELM